MQGRLSPKPNHEERIQFFPADWQQEFRIAREIGFNCIEWLIDWQDFEKNPLLSGRGLEEIRSVSLANKLPTLSVCSDYFMKYPLFGRDPEIVVKKELVPQLEGATILGQKLFLIPLLEAYAVKTEAQKQEIIKVVRAALAFLKKHDLRIGFETELPAEELIDFVDRFESPNVGVYYDIGNSTSYGFDCPADLEKLGVRVFGVHLKDRKVGSAQSVGLGKGQADFEKCFAVLSKIGYNGTYILQAWRGENYLTDAKEQFKFVRSIADKI